MTIDIGLLSCYYVNVVEKPQRNQHPGERSNEMSYAKLRGKIREKFGTQEAFATAMGMNPASLSSKLNLKTEWTRQEIEKACVLLEIPLADAHLYFF